MKKENLKILLIIASFVLFFVVVASLTRPLFIHIKRYVESLIVVQNNNDDDVINSSSDSIGNIIVGNNNSSLAIPSKIYGYKNIPVKLYFVNITQHISSDELIFKVKDSGKGKTYKDRWEYTPKKAESFIIEISVYDKNEVFIDSVETLIEIKDSSQKDKLSVLVLGDSTIEASYETETLLNLSKEDNYPLSLVGTKTSFFNNLLNVHEGRGGWSAYLYTNFSEAISDTNPFYNYYSEGDYEFDFSYYMKQNGFESLDCVVIQLGINDVYGYKNDTDLNYAAENYIHYMEYMIRNIRSYDKDIKIVWNLILPPSSDEYKYDSDYTAQRAKINTYLTNLQIIRRYSNTKNLYICPTNAAVDSENDIADTVHPTQDGYEEIGTMLYAFLRGIN